MEWTEIVAVIRDFAVIALALIAIAVIAILYAKVNSLLGAAGRIARAIEYVTSAIAANVGPAGAGAGFLAGVARVATAIFGDADRRDRDLD